MRPRATSRRSRSSSGSARRAWSSTWPSRSRRPSRPMPDSASAGRVTRTSNRRWRASSITLSRTRVFPIPAGPSIATADSGAVPKTTSSAAATSRSRPSTALIGGAASGPAPRAPDRRLLRARPAGAMAGRRSADDGSPRRRGFRGVTRVGAPGLGSLRSRDWVVRLDWLVGLDPEHPRLIRTQFHTKALAAQLAGGPAKLEPGAGIGEPHDVVVGLLERQRVGEADARSRGAATLAGCGRGDRPVDADRRVAIAVIHEHEAAIGSAAVRVGIDVLIDRPVVGVGVVEVEIGGAREGGAAPQERDDRPREVIGMRLVDRLVPAGLPELHAVALPEAFHLAVPEHRQ